MKSAIALTVFAVLLSATRPVSAADGYSDKLPKGTVFFVPKDSAARWLIEPGLLTKLDKTPLSFNVLPSGKISLGSTRFIFTPELLLTMTTKVKIEEFIWLAGGNMLVHSGKSLGFLNVDMDDEKTEPKKKGKGMLSFTSKFTVPYEQWHLYPGQGDFFYVIGRNDKEKRNEISVWNLADEKIPVKPLFATTDPIGAVAGTPQKTYFSIGREVFVLENGATKPKSVYVHAREDIRDLIYRPDAGLFFTTKYTAGYIGEKGPIEFLVYPDVELKLRGDALYVRLGRLGNGIIRITGPAHFADLTIDPPAK